MKAYLAFTKKEFCEMLRTYKLFIMGIVFLIFGVMNPLTAKFTPALVREFAPQGMAVTLPEPAAIDSWAQFFKNIPQIGLIILVIVFSTMLTAELSKGTLINILTKGLPRKTVILSKFTSSGLVWTGAYILCFAVTWAYTVYFWEDRVGTKALLLSVCALWLFGLLLLAILLLGSVLLKSGYGCLLFTGASVVIMLFLNILPEVQKYNPISLASKNMALLNGQIALNDIAPAFAAAAGIGAISLTVSCLVFNKRML